MRSLCTGFTHPKGTPMLKIDYRLVGSGWAECTICTDEGSCELSTSYLSDALGNLVLAAAAVLSGAHSISVGFDEEPGEFRWSVTRMDSSTIRLNILSFEELWGNRPDAEGSVLFSWIGPPLEFGRSVRDAAEALLQKHSLADYKKQWVEHDFPSTELELLRSHIATWERNR